MSQIKRVVLDTHVWLDIWVFDEPSCQPLKSLLGIDGHALEAKPKTLATTEPQANNASYQAILSKPCLEELQRVLFYPTIQKFWHKKMNRPMNESDCAWVTEQMTQHALWIEDEGDQPTQAIPKCQDPKDQMLFELACKGQATALISQDLLVLRLAKAMAPFGCEVLTMKDFLNKAIH